MLQCNISNNDIGFCYTNCAWMVWHWLISLLAVGSTLILFDGSPFYPNENSIWKLIQDEKITYFGTSARFLGAHAQLNTPVKSLFDVSHLRLITSTGPFILY